MRKNGVFKIYSLKCLKVKKNSKTHSQGIAGGSGADADF